MPEFTIRLELAPSPEWTSLLGGVAEAAFGQLRKALEELGEESAAMRLDITDMRKEMARRLPLAGPAPVDLQPVLDAIAALAAPRPATAAAPASAPADAPLPVEHYPHAKAPAVWSPERDALGRKMRLEGAFDRDILAALNRLPGPPLRSVQALHHRASDCRWPRSPHVPSLTRTTWTPEREAEGRRLRAEGVPLPDILPALNALPGIPIASAKALRNHAGRQQWPKPTRRVEPATAPGHTDLMVAPETIDAFLDANPPPTAPETEPTPDPEPAPEPPPLAPVWTQERDELGRELRAAGHSWLDILARLNALPGMPVSSLSALQQRAYARQWPAPPKALEEPPVLPERRSNTVTVEKLLGPDTPRAVRGETRPVLAQRVAVGRDGLPSVAAQMERDIVRSTRLNPVSWQTVREWAANQKLFGMPDVYSPKALLAVNKLRASHLLPPFHVVRA